MRREHHLSLPTHRCKHATIRDENITVSSASTHVQARQNHGRTVLEFHLSSIIASTHCMPMVTSSFLVPAPSIPTFTASHPRLALVPSTTTYLTRLLILPCTPLPITPIESETTSCIWLILAASSSATNVCLLHAAGERGHGTQLEEAAEFKGFCPHYPRL